VAGIFVCISYAVNVSATDANEGEPMDKSIDFYGLFACLLLVELTTVQQDAEI
jgi:hypothetical protein